MPVQATKDCRGEETRDVLNNATTDGDQCVSPANMIGNQVIHISREFVERLIGFGCLDATLKD